MRCELYTEQVISWASKETLSHTHPFILLEHNHYDHQFVCYYVAEAHLRC
jgi:hypothetical protein